MRWAGRRLRQSSEMPVIMLTAKDEVTDKVMGLDIGADKSDHQSAGLIASTSSSPVIKVFRLAIIVRKNFKAACSSGSVKSVKDPINRCSMISCIRA